MSITYWFISILIFILTFNSHAETWQAELVHGGKAQADAQTRKPVINRDGSTSQLWDGVHTMEDGSIVIVKDGVVVPNESMYRAWTKASDVSQSELEINDCELLTRRVCGVKNSCAKEKACDLAQQLQKLWENAPDAANGLSRTGKNECHQALTDSAVFPPCETDAKPPVACASLVAQVCGDNNECTNNSACNAARQLLNLAQEAVLKNTALTSESKPEQYCYEAMNNNFFAACKKIP